MMYNLSVTTEGSRSFSGFHCTDIYLGKTPPLKINFLTHWRAEATPGGEADRLSAIHSTLSSKSSPPVSSPACSFTSPQPPSPVHRTDQTSFPLLIALYKALNSNRHSLKTHRPLAEAAKQVEELQVFHFSLLLPRSIDHPL